MRLSKLLGALLALAAVWMATAAQAATSVRIEWMKAGYVYSAETITSTGASQASSAAPSFGGVSGQARVTVLSGSAYVTCCDTAPVATATGGMRLEGAHGPAVFTLAGGQKLAVLDAGDESHVGRVSGDIVVVTVTPTVTASSAYSANQFVGGLLTFAGAAARDGGTGFIQSVTLNFKSSQTAATDFVWCGANNPTNSTITDKSAVALAVADFDKCRAIPVTACTNLGTPSVCSADNLAFPFVLSTGTTGYGFLVTRGTPTYTATTDVSMALRIMR